MPLQNDLQNDHSPEFSKELQEKERKYVAEVKKLGSATQGTQYNYAVVLLKSPHRTDHERSLALLSHLHKTHPTNGLYMYSAALAAYKLGKYSESRNFVHLLLENDPLNSDALELEKAISSKVKEEGLMGIAIAGGVLGVATIASIVGFKLLKK